MPYRRAYKRPRYGKRDKYSVQQKAFQFSADAGQSSTWLLVPATTLEGMRKVKHLMVNLTIDPDTAGPMWWAIVYVPQGNNSRRNQRDNEQRSGRGCMNPTSSS